MPFHHSVETRARAVALVRHGAWPSAAARLVGADPSTVYEWLHVDAPDLIRSPSRRCWRCRSELESDLSSYAHLLGLYLGDGWLTTTGRSTYLSVACDDNWPGLARECEQSMRLVPATSVCRVRRKGCHEVKGYSKHWPCLLPQHGPGKKHQRRIVLEQWRRQIVELHPGRLLRGLFHSDGWRGDNVAVRTVGDRTERRYYSRYDFMNKSDDIRGICGDALDLLGIAWRPNGPWRISVARREAVAALDEYVGPKY